jgi:uncharacterized phage infection (PIP) family protein YhgE
MTVRSHKPREAAMIRTLERAFSSPQAEVLAEVITDAYDDLVKTGDFNELKAIVRQLAEGQVALQAETARLAEGQVALQAETARLAEGQVALQAETARLAEGQVALQAEVRTLAVGQAELRAEMLGLTAEVRTLAEGQAELRTEMLGLTAEVRGLAGGQAELRSEMTRLGAEMTNLGAEMTKLVAVTAATRSELGGLARSTGYALENEAYRALPAFLAAHHGIQLTERLIRTEIDGQEINFFGRGEENGEALLIVGEAKLQLGSVSALTELNQSVAMVRKAHPGIRIVPLLVAHFARPAFLTRAAARDVIVVQSFEW